MQYEKFRSKALKIVNEKQFHAGQTSSILWELHAQALKHAADKLYDIHYEAVMHEYEDIQKELKEHGRLLPCNRQMADKEVENSYDKSLSRIYFFLVGLSIELLLKAKLISMGNKPEKIIGHDLNRLCEMCKIKIEKDEIDWLKKLTSYIKWQGRYPIPLKKEGMDDIWLNTEKAYQNRQRQVEITNLFLKIRKHPIKVEKADI